MAAWLAWRAGFRLEQPITALIRSAERFGQGDYTRPVDIVRRDELGELQQALEHMRYKLRQTTITKNYLNSVLNGMTGCRIREFTGGRVRVANQAACKLLGYAEGELLGKNIAFILEERERPTFDLARASHESRETLVQTRQGTTIPVSLTGSQLGGDDPLFQGCIFVARNITEQKRTERRIPLSRALRHSHPRAQSHAVPASAAADHRPRRP